MKTNYFLSLLLMMAFCLNLSASNSDLFNYNKEAVNSNLSELSELEVFVSENPTNTLSILVAGQHKMVSGLDLYGPNSMGISFAEPPLGIPSFLWGCAFGIIGVAIVYFVTEEDKAETKKSFFGCITGSVISGVLYAVLYASYI